ncbi:MAG TPA: site-specific recombinase [Methylibium sp.]|nr:site-specific recombinase [Methylibium sp.]
MSFGSRRRGGWDLTALLNAADPKAPPAERHLWLARLLEWLRHAPAPAADGGETSGSPLPLRRLRHLLGVLDRHAEHQGRVVGLLRAFRAEVDVATLLADHGFAPRNALFSELGERLRLRFLPPTPDTTDLGALFGLLFSDAADADWLDALDEATLARVAALWSHAAPEAGPLGWRAPVYDALMFLAAQVSAAGGSGALRQRMDEALLVAQPFRQLLRSTERLCAAAEQGNAEAQLREARFLRALLDACRDAAASVRGHLEDHGISVELLFQVDQLRARARRIETLLGLLLAEDGSREQRAEVVRLIAGFVRLAAQRRSVRALFARQYSMLARRIAERSADTGEHYITRTRDEWWAMLKKALGGGAVIAGTTFAKFAVVALGLSAFWGGFFAGVNYAGSFVLIHLLHWTVATKQPAMTAPAMAQKLEDVSDAAAVEGFVDEVAHLIRSQTAGIVGNLAMVFPLVLLVQWGAQALFGAPLVGRESAEHVLHDLTLLGPTLAYAAFTGILLFASSLIAGWAENWFVLHRLDSAIRWNPRILATLGPQRAAHWSRWWRDNVSGLAANVSLGFLLGLVPVVCAFFALPIQVRHVTLSTGQLAAALGTLGHEALVSPAFWWCIAAIPLTGALNLSVSFLLAFKVALRSRSVRVGDRARLYAALRRRLRTRFASFLLPPREAEARAAA